MKPVDEQPGDVWRKFDQNALTPKAIKYIILLRINQHRIPSFCLAPGEDQVTFGEGRADGLDKQKNVGGKY